VSLPPPAAWPVQDPVADPSGDLLRERALSTPDASAVVDADTGEELTYAAFDGRVSGLAHALADRGVSGGRVGVALPTGLSFAEVYFAVGRRGGAVVPGGGDGAG